MKYLTNQKMVEGIQNPFLNNKKENPAFQKEWRHEEPLLCLRFWENDYPYLKKKEDNSKRWLPIPENSEVQRIIRNQHRLFQFK